MKQVRIGLFGEVLFDYFPDGSRVAGGAPLNVAWHLQAIGDAPLLISRVGADAAGAALHTLMQQWNLNPAEIQQDLQRPTGRVEVQLQGGEPHYQILENAAWDAISTPSDCRLDWLYHGSLALRSLESRLSFREFAENQRLQNTQLYFDVNLRPPWVVTEEIQHHLEQANWAKMNEGEFRILWPETRDIDRETLEAARQRWMLDGLIVTQGSRGAKLITHQTFLSGRAPKLAPARIRDTVGAGDAFSSIMLHGLAQNWPLPRCLDRALDFAAEIVCQRGATPGDPLFYQSTLRHWAAQDAESER